MLSYSPFPHLVDPPFHMRNKRKNRQEWKNFNYVFNSAFVFLSQPNKVRWPNFRVLCSGIKFNLEMKSPRVI
jgi:hypothetical protein